MCRHIRDLLEELAHIIREAHIIKEAVCCSQDGDPGKAGGVIQFKSKGPQSEGHQCHGPAQAESKFVLSLLFCSI